MEGGTALYPPAATSTSRTDLTSGANIRMSQGLEGSAVEASDDALVLISACVNEALEAVVEWEFPIQFSFTVEEARELIETDRIGSEAARQGPFGSSAAPTRRGATWSAVTRRAHRWLPVRAGRPAGMSRSSCP